MKKRRVQNKKLLDEVRIQPCLVCGRAPSDPDHITTRGAGGGDTKDNVWPLCHPHHVMRHYKGLMHMVRAFEACRDWLIENERNDILNKLGGDFEKV